VRADDPYPGLVEIGLVQTASAQEGAVRRAVHALGGDARAEPILLAHVRLSHVTRAHMISIQLTDRLAAPSRSGRRSTQRSTAGWPHRDDQRRSSIIRRARSRAEFRTSRETFESPAVRAMITAPVMSA